MLSIYLFFSFLLAFYFHSCLNERLHAAVYAKAWLHGLTYILGNKAQKGEDDWSSSQEEEEEKKLY